MPSYYQTQNCYMRQGQMSGQPKMGCPAQKEYPALEGLAAAMAYVPWQKWKGIYDLEKGFCCGTIFEELNKPFQGMGGRR